MSPAPATITTAEFAECHVACAKLAPLDALDPKKVAGTLKPAPGSPIYLLCKSGGRARKAAEQFIAAGIANVCVVTGGTEACVAAGLSVARGGKAALPLDGQVRIVLGSLILLFWLLGRFAHPAFDYLVPLMAIGLLVTGATGFCGTAFILGKAPWNRKRGTESYRGC